MVCDSAVYTEETNTLTSLGMLETVDALTQGDPFCMLTNDGRKEVSCVRSSIVVYSHRGTMI